MSRVLVNKPQPLEERFVRERDAMLSVFGVRVRQERIRKELTLEMLAERSDLHANYVGSVERGERNVSLYNIWRIADGLGVAPTELLEGLPKRSNQ